MLFLSRLGLSQKRSSDPNPTVFPKVLPYKWGGVLPCKWEAYCKTNGRRITGFPFLRSLEARKARRYTWGAYCRTIWRCTAVLFRQVVGVGVSETFPTFTGNEHGFAKIGLEFGNAPGFVFGDHHSFLSSSDQRVLPKSF